MTQNVYQKLQLARLLLQEKKLTKSGKNKFAGYEYFELQDFLPTVQTIFADTGLCAVFRCGVSDATLTIYNTTNPEDYVLFTAPMAAAELKGCHPVQNLGASISYLRRYLYVNALEIVEHDALDATTGKESLAPKPVPKAAEPKPVPKTETIEGKPGEWQMVVTGTPGDADWMELVEDAANKLLDFATNEEDVMAIYKKNKQLFEEVKAQDAVFFKDLMNKFTEARNKFKEAA
jgi:hypothetical protein